MVYWKVLTVIFVLFSWPVWLSLRKSVCSVIWINWMISVWSRSMPRLSLIHIFWSWHIWCTEQPEEQKYVIPTNDRTYSGKQYYVCLLYTSRKVYATITSWFVMTMQSPPQWHLANMVSYVTTGTHLSLIHILGCLYSQKVWNNTGSLHHMCFLLTQ